MKVKRHKTAKKILSFYKNNFNFVPPYHILVDGTFCKAALNQKINILEQLSKYLDGEVRLWTTQCVISECERLGSLLFGPLKILKQFDVHSCGHTTKPVPVVSCLKKTAKSCFEKKFGVATQDSQLGDKCRRKAGIPLFHVTHKTIILETPSEASYESQKELTRQQMLSTNERETINTLKKQLLGEPMPISVKKRKKREPNPLSCKKKKAISNIQKEVKKRRPRKRNKIAEHVKVALEQKDKTAC